MKCRIVTGVVARNEGRLILDCPIDLPLESVRTKAKSFASRITGENACRTNVAADSSRIEMIRFHKISRTIELEIFTEEILPISLTRIKSLTT
jgi:hypothetical protein